MRLADRRLGAANLLLLHGFPAFASSRAYYAMFAAAQALLLSKDSSFSKHSAVISAFGQHFANTGLVSVHLHRAIITAQEHRQAADCSDEKEITCAEAERDLGNAEELVRCARRLLAMT
ncbi:MAG: HEPN domain-containing protein [Pseudomonadota bacterium]